MIKKNVDNALIKFQFDYFVHTSTSNLGEANGGSFKKNKREAYRKWLCHTQFNLLSFDFSIEISTFSSLFYCNLCFLFTFLLKSLLSLYFSIEISTFSLLFY